MANELNYTAYDFDYLVVQLQDRLSSSSWKDVYRSSTGQMLIEFLAYVLNMGMYYTERRANESYLLTAQNRSSIVNLVKLLNYEPKRKTSASGILTFSIDEAETKNIYIPKYTECQSSNGTKYVTNEDSVLEKGQTSVDVKSIQGKINSLEISASGSENQEYVINNTSVEDSADSDNPTLRVVVGGVPWTKVSSFLYSVNTDTHYRVINEMESTVTIQFGDDVNGKSPEAGSVITIYYVESEGLAGNVTHTGMITTINSTIYDEDGDAATGVDVTNDSSFLGGDDEEDIEEIRYEAPRVFKTGDRAVTKTDFISILENYSGVASVNVWGENEEAELAGTAAVQSMLNKVKMCIVLQSWELPDDTFKNTLSDYIYNKSMMTVKYEFVTPTILDVIPTLEVTVESGHSLSQAQADLEEAVAAKFALGDTTRLGTIIKYSEIIATIHDLDNVAYVTGVLEIKKTLSDSYEPTYDFGGALEATDIKPESVRLFIGGTYITSDEDNGDGTGSFSSAGAYTINGTIDYSTGVLLIDISGEPESVFVRYCQDEGGNIIPSFQEICRLDEVDIVSIEIES